MSDIFRNVNRIAIIICQLKFFDSGFDASFLIQEGFKDYFTIFSTEFINLIPPASNNSTSTAYFRTIGPKFIVGIIIEQKEYLGRRMPFVVLLNDYT